MDRGGWVLLAGGRERGAGGGGGGGGGGRGGGGGGGGAGEEIPVSIIISWVIAAVLCWGDQLGGELLGAIVNLAYVDVACHGVWKSSRAMIGALLL